METTPPAAVALVLLAPPLAMGLVALVGLLRPGRHPVLLGRALGLATPLTLFGALAAALVLAVEGPATSPILGVAGIGLSFRLDPLAVTMTLLVVFLAAIVLRFSRNYLDGDARQSLFFGELGLTIAAVLLLVSAGNLVQLTAGWFLGSVALQRLLVFRADRPRALAAARKKFVIARCADLALLGAVILLVRA
ncbi:MAG: hypothetical protein KDB18_13315, partial [Salinibacterium sp.]|nr:hypothetical protein [Salinibacterium sp.]